MSMKVRETQMTSSSPFSHDLLPKRATRTGNTIKDEANDRGIPYGRESNTLTLLLCNNTNRNKKIVKNNSPEGKSIININSD